jgi:hypothetical protein
MRVLIALGLGVLLAAGCRQPLPARSDRGEGGSLRAAGFRAVPGSTPERIEALRTLRPRAFSRVQRDGETWYVWPDPAGCSCLYVGREAELEAWKRLRIARDGGPVGWEPRDAPLGIQVWNPALP